MENISKEISYANYMQRDGKSFKDSRSTEEILTYFGYEKGDKISDRDLVIIYKRVESDMEKELYECARTGRYNEAKDLKNRLIKFKREFNDMQIDRHSKSHSNERNLLEEASLKVGSQLQEDHNKQKQQVDNYCQNQRNQLNKFHEIEKLNLDKQISREVMPSIKYSCRYLELLKAEHELIKLDLFDDARKVRRMIDHIKPKEEKAFIKAYNDSIDARYKDLEEKQKRACEQLDERLKVVEWKDIRSCERQSTIEATRMQIHKMNMDHFHHLEAKLKPEMSIKPSALLLKRAGYQATSSSLRGRQVMKSITGVTSSDTSTVTLESLVDLHDFDHNDSGTVDYYRK